MDQHLAGYHQTTPLPSTTHSIFRTQKLLVRISIFFLYRIYKCKMLLKKKTTINIKNIYIIVIKLCFIFNCNHVKYIFKNINRFLNNEYS